MKKFIGVVAGIALALGVGTATAAFATDQSPSYSTTKYDTTFTYQGGNVWKVTPKSAQFALHNIGAHQSWLCNTNNVGHGIKPCVVGHAYTTNGDTSGIPSGFDSCVYIQGDSPAFDTVPGDPTKRVCAPPPTPCPTPTESTPPTPSPTPTESTPPTPEPTPTESTPPTPSPTPTETQSAPPVPSDTPSETPKPTPVTTQKLAETGTESAPWLIASAILIALGIVLIVLRRKRLSK